MVEWVLVVAIMTQEGKHHSRDLDHLLPTEQACKTQGRADVIAMKHQAIDAAFACIPLSSAPKEEKPLKPVNLI